MYKIFSEKDLNKLGWCYTGVLYLYSTTAKLMKISIEGTEYEIELYDDILLHSFDHTLVIKEGWQTLLGMYDYSRDYAMFRLDSFIHSHIKEAVRVSE